MSKPSPSFLLLLTTLISIVYANNLRSSPSYNEENAVYKNTSRSLASSSTTTTQSSTTRSYLQKDYTNLPQVFLLGAQKAGTESMFDVLIKHDKLCGSNGEGSGNWKESHFYRGLNFNSDGTLKKPELWDLYQKGYDDPKCMNGKGRFIDGTPALHSCQAMFEIYSFYPPEIRNKLKFIVVLREPVSRDWSGFTFGLTHFHHFNEEKTPILQDKDAFLLSEKKNDYFFTKKVEHCDHDPDNLNLYFRSRYVLQFEEFVKYFRRDQLLIFNVEFIFDDPDAAMEAVRQFLNLDKGWEKNLDFPWYAHPPNFKESVPPLYCKDRDALAAYYKPFNDRLYEWINKDGGKRPKSEPTFKPFKSHEDVACVNE